LKILLDNRFQVLKSGEMETTMNDGGDFKSPSPMEFKNLLKALNLLSRTRARMHQNAK
jgi:hypothetical protein